MAEIQRWKDEIQRAKSANGVEAILNDYVSWILPSELSATPDSFVRALAGAGVDLQVAAVTLLQEEMRFNGGGETAALMHQIALIFAAGSQRLLHMRNMFRPSE